MRMGGLKFWFTSSGFSFYSWGMLRVYVDLWKLQVTETPG